GELCGQLRKPDVPESCEPQDGTKTAGGLDWEPERSLHRRQSLRRRSAIEVPVDRLPLTKREGLRPAFRIDARVAQTRPGTRAADATDAAQRTAKLLPAELKDGLDQPEESVEVVYAHRGVVPYIEDHARGIDARWRGERRGGDREQHSRGCKHLHRHGGQARAAGCGPALCDLLLDDQRKASGSRWRIQELSNQRAGEVVRNVAGDDVSAVGKQLVLIHTKDVGLHDL